MSQPEQSTRQTSTTAAVVRNDNPSNVHGHPALDGYPRDDDYVYVETARGIDSGESLLQPDDTDDYAEWLGIDQLDWSFSPLRRKGVEVEQDLPKHGPPLRAAESFSGQVDATVGRSVSHNILVKGETRDRVENGDKEQRFIWFGNTKSGARTTLAPIIDETDTTLSPNEDYDPSKRLTRRCNTCFRWVKAEDRQCQHCGSPAYDYTNEEKYNSVWAFNDVTNRKGTRGAANYANEYRRNQVKTDDDWWIELQTEVVFQETHIDFEPVAKVLIQVSRNEFSTGISEVGQVIGATAYVYGRAEAWRVWRTYAAIHDVGAAALLTEQAQGWNTKRDINLFEFVVKEIGDTLRSA